MKSVLIIIGLFFLTLTSSAQDIQLPQPVKTGGQPFMDVLSKRQSDRSFNGQELDSQTLSNLLWAANGFNREDKRTVPSSQNRQEIDLYVMLKDAVYFYDAKENILKLIVTGDFRKNLGAQAYVNDAALNFVFVANLDKASNRDAALIDCGYISQNIYLFCTSEGLGSIARGSANAKALHQDLGLSANQEVLLSHCVGYIK